MLAHPRHLFAAVALLLAGGLAVTLAAGAVKGRPTALAVVDVQKSFDSLSEKVQVEADLQSAADKIKQEELDRQKDLKQLQEDLGILARNTAAFTQKSDELEKKVVEFQAWRNWQTAKLSRERGVRIEDIYRKLTDAIGRVAKESGYDMVLFKEGPIRFPADKPEQISAMVQVRKVLWAADDLDLTEQVIQKMNNEYKNAATATPAAK
jgi:Skp family chaperone for outer membrane proteins